MRKLTIFLTISVGWILCLAALSLAQAPELREQLIYGLNAFNGRGYGGGFTPLAEDTIYLIADKDNTISANITLVYFWPITGKYVAGFKALNEVVEGTLEILQGGKVIKALEKEDNTLYYPDGYWEQTSIFYQGEEAYAQFEKFTQAIGEYYEQINQYYEAQAEYQESFQEFLDELTERREAGEELVLEEVEARMPREPKQPAPPIFYVTPPKRDYIINLPLGRYKIRIRAEDGTIVQDSDKDLVLFTSRRTGGTGYEVIPGNRWTRRESVDDPSWLIYAAGKNTLYFSPFVQDEYNELYYNKLLDPQNPGREQKWRWVHIKAIEDVTLLFLKGKETLRRIVRVPYYVEQIPGPELGYEIVEFNPEEMLDRQATFEGYKLDLAPTLEKTSYEINLEKKEGEFFQGSRREVRLVKKENAQSLYAFSIFPLLVGVVVFVTRRRKLGS